MIIFCSSWHILFPFWKTMFHPHDHESLPYLSKGMSHSPTHNKSESFPFFMVFFEAWLTWSLLNMLTDRMWWLVMPGMYWGKLTCCKWCGTCDAGSESGIDTEGWPTMGPPNWDIRSRFKSGWDTWISRKSARRYYV